jgi:Methyltransferase FkbM domain
MSPINRVKKMLHVWRHRFLPPSRAYVSWRFDQLYARIDALEERLSPELQPEITTILRLLEPKKATDYVKIRVGTHGDGGYVQLDDLEGISRAFSFGVADNDDWDLAIARRGIPVEQFDHSIKRAPSTHPLLHFHRKMISVNSAVETAAIPDLAVAHSKLTKPDLILKMDIENSEWDVLDHTPEAVLSKFAQIVCEFHNLSHLTNSLFRARARRVFEKLHKHFAPIHVHGNNCCGIISVCNISLPDLLEVTFANRARYSFVECNEIFPTSLDAPNCPHLAEIRLGAFRF